MSDNWGSTIVVIGAVALGGYLLLKYLGNIVPNAVSGAVGAVDSSVGSGIAGIAGDVYGDLTGTTLTPSQQQQGNAFATEIVKNPVGSIFGAGVAAYSGLANVVTGNVPKKSSSVNKNLKVVSLQTQYTQAGKSNPYQQVAVSGGGSAALKSKQVLVSYKANAGRVF